MATLNEVMKDTADAIREKTGKSELIAPVDFAEEIKGITAGGGSGESGGSTLEYLDLSGNSPLRDALITFSYLIKTDGFRIEHTGSNTWHAERGIIVSGNLLVTVLGMTYDDYRIVKDSIKAVAVDFNTEIVMQDTIMPIKDVFTGAEEMLNAIPRLTKEEFYDLNA
jgi:hypothetical protein